MFKRNKLSKNIYIYRERANGKRRNILFPVLATSQFETQTCTMKKKTVLSTAKTHNMHGFETYGLMEKPT